MYLQFLGATETVTGSKYLVEAEGRRILVDCGLFQGLKRLRLRNREPLPVDPRSIEAVLLTHAHIDHTGYLPVLVRDGFRGPVFCTAATQDLCRILLPDAARLQEEEAEYANRRGFSKHRPALPLYTSEDADAALELLRPVDYGYPVEPAPGFTAVWGRAGHILGAAWIRLQTPGGPAILFSGDIGRPGDPLVRPPEPPPEADLLLLESTYGDRLHGPGDPAEELAAHITRTAARGGVVVIPAFAVGRAQTLLHLLARLAESGNIPRIPVFLDSPMARDATDLLALHRGEHRLTEADLRAMKALVQVANSVEESKAISARNGPMVVVSAGGMATGGRVLHHLRTFAPDHRNLVLFSGFQAAGTRGASLVGGEGEVRIHGTWVPVRAEVAVMDTLSAHADYRELLDWVGRMPRPPAHTFLTHGEAAAADALRRRMEAELGWSASVPGYLDLWLPELSGASGG